MSAAEIGIASADVCGGRVGSALRGQAGTSLTLLVSSRGTQDSRALNHRAGPHVTPLGAKTRRTCALIARIPGLPCVGARVPTRALPDATGAAR